MTNVFSPQGPNAANTMPPGNDVVRYGTNKETWVRNASGPGMKDGTVLDAAFFNRIIGNLHHVIEQSGVTAKPGDFSALYRAITRMSARPLKFGDGLQLDGDQVGLAVGALDLIGEIDPGNDRLPIWSNVAKKVLDTTAFSLVDSVIDVEGALRKISDPVTGRISFIIDRDNILTSDRKVIGTNGVGGGGLLREDPQLYLDLNSLDTSEANFDPWSDKLPMLDASTGKSVLVTLDRLVTLATLGVEDRLDIAKEQIDLRVDNALATALAGVNTSLGELQDTAEDLAAQADGLATSVANDIATVQGTVNDLSTYVTELDDGLATQLSTVNGIVNELQETAGILTTDLDSQRQQAIGMLDSIDGLTSDLGALLDEVTAQEAVITGLSNAVAGKAEASALTSLATRVTDAEGVNTSQAAAITNLNTTVAGKAAASAVTALDTRVTATENTNSSQATAITNLQTDLAGKAAASALTALTTRVTDAEGVNSSQATAITNLNTAVAGKAAASAVTALDTRVTAAEGVNSSQATAITNLNTALAGKAAASALSDLTTRVTEAEGAIDAQSTQLTDLTTTVAGKASASAVSSLDTRVTAVEGVNTSQSTSITNLNNALPGKADASALNALTTRVTAAEGVNTSQGTAITTLQNDVAGKASASALSALTTRVTDAEGVNTSQGSAITNLQNDVAGKAAASALSALDTRVTAAEGVNSSQATAITNLNTALAGKAAASAVTALTTRMDEAEDAIDAQSTSITTLQNDVAGKAAASALSALESRVTSAEGVNTSQGSAITNLNNALPGKADASALNALTTRVTAAEGVNTSQGTAITTLQNDVAGKASASALSALDTRVTAAEGVNASQATSINALQAGSMAYKKRWDFLSAIEGWTCNSGTATVDTGSLRPANSTDAWISSPVGLAIDAAAMDRVQFRIKKVGAPVWDGGLYWAAVGQNFAFDGTRKATFPAPVFDADGYAVVTVVPGWTGTIDKFRLDIFAGQDASNYFLIDWIGVGRLDSSAVANLAAKSEEINGAVSTQATQITNLNTAVAGKADSSALSALESRVTSAEGVNTSQGTSITNLNNSLAGKADASALSALTTRVTDAEGVNTSQGTSITNLNNTVAGKADASALSALESRVTSAEGVNTSQGTSITNLNNSLAGKADASALSALTTRVTNTENTNSSQATDITNLNTSLAGKASASALSTLTATVNQIDLDVDAVAAAVTKLSAGTGTDVATALFQMSAVSAPAGWSSRIALQARGGTGDTFKSAGIYLDVVTGGASRVVIEADKFVVQNGTSATIPFSVSGGAVYLQNVWVNGGNILANTISVGKLTVGAMLSDNLIADGNFEDASAEAWTKSGGTQDVVAMTDALSGGRALRMDRGTTTGPSINAIYGFIPVTPGDEYLIEFDIKADIASAAGAYLRLNYYDAAKNPITVGSATYTDVYGNGAITTAFVTRAGTRAIPAGVKYVRPQVYHHSTSSARYLYVSSVVMRRRVAGELIVDGSITASKLAVGIGQNLIANSDFLAGNTGWGQEYAPEPASFTVSGRYDTYAALGSALEIRQINGNQLNGSNQVVYGISPYNPRTNSQMNYEVVGNDWYEFSVYCYGHRAKGCEPYIQWLTDNLSHISYSSLGALTANQGGNPAQLLSAYATAWNKFQAPATAKFARVFFRHMGTVSGQSDSYVWIKRPYFGKASGPNQTVRSPWSEGAVTLIQGGNIATNTIQAAHIATYALTASNATLGNLEVDTINIKKNAIIPSRMQYVDKLNGLRDPDLSEDGFWDAWSVTSNNGTKIPATITRVLNNALDGKGVANGGSKYRFTGVAPAGTYEFKFGALTENVVPVEGGRTYYVGAWLGERGNNTTVRDVRVLYQECPANDDGTPYIDFTSNALNPAGYAEGTGMKWAGGNVTVGGNTRFLRIIGVIKNADGSFFSGTMTMSNPIVRATAGLLVSASTFGQLGPFGTGNNILQECTVSHGKSIGGLGIHGSFKNVSGAAQMFDISLEYWGGDGTIYTIITNLGINVGNNGMVDIHGHVEALEDVWASTIRLRVVAASGGNTVSQRRLFVTAHW